MSTDNRLDDVAKLVKKIRSGEVDTDTLYEFVLMGYKCFKGGSGLPPNMVYDTIYSTVIEHSDDIVGD